MPNQFVNTIVFVSDLQESKRFYKDILGIKVKEDLKTVVFFENRLVLHCARSIMNTVFKQAVKASPNAQGSKNLLVYLECETPETLDRMYSEMKDKVSIIHEIEPQEWGQRVFRFYDPDGHIVELGEPQTRSLS